MLDRKYKQVVAVRARHDFFKVFANLRQGFSCRHFTGNSEQSIVFSAMAQGALHWLSPITLSTEQKHLCPPTNRQAEVALQRSALNTRLLNTVLESHCFETQEDDKSSKEKPHQIISKYSLVALFLFACCFRKSETAMEKIKFPLWKAHGKSLGKVGFCLHHCRLPYALTASSHSGVKKAK